MINVSRENLHPNSIISELLYQDISKTDSICPERISINDITLIPMHQANFKEIRNLFRYTDDDVFKHYGSTNHNLPYETRKYVQRKEKLWKNAEWFEYVIKYENNYIGKTYLNANSKLDAFERGIWLQKDYWGNQISQKIADALIHITFEELDASYFDVGCVIQNVKSRKSIEKYIYRYNGSFYGFVPKTNTVYHSDEENPTKVVKHPEWVITQEDYNSHNSGISTTMPNVNYEDIEFDKEYYI